MKSASEQESSKEAADWFSRSWYDDGSWADANKKAKLCWWEHSSGEDQSWSWQAWGSSSWCSDTRDDAYTTDDEWVIEPTGTHSATLIFLHSCHGRPQHTSGFVEDLRQHAMLDEKRLRIVAPCAPRRITELDRDGTFQWFEYKTEQLLAGADQDDIDKVQLLEQRQRLLLLLNNELQKLPADGQMVIGGLSQGASMVADLLLHLEGPPDRRLRGAFFKRGFVQRESVEDLSEATSFSTFADLAVLATHGVEDDWVPFDAAQKSYDLLRSRGCVMTFRAIPGLKHNGYDDAEARALSEFVVGLLQLGN